MGLRNKRILLTLLVVLCGLFAQSQNDIVEGVVKGTDGVPIPGVTIIVKGTTKGAITDFDGFYTIKASIGDVLEFSYIGMRGRSLKVTGTKLNVTLEEEIDELDEVVVIGYGEVKKKRIDWSCNSS